MSEVPSNAAHVDTLNEALRLLDKGYSVIPLEVRAKEPLVHWKVYQQRLATREEIQAWWQKWPNANLGVITGRISGIVVVDIDETRGGDYEKVLSLGPTDRVVRTAHGYHLWYKYPENGTVSNRVGVDGVDIRGEGGMVVVPPSLHPEGVFYRYQQQGELGTAPAWVKDLPGPNLTTRGENWISQLLDTGVERGSRNSSCASLAGYFYNKRLPEDIATTLLISWNLKNQPPLSMETVSRTVKSVYQTARNREEVTTTIVAEQEETINGVPVDENGIVQIRDNSNQPYVVDTMMDETDARLELSTMSYSSFCNKYGDGEIAWTVRDWIPAETIAFVVAPPGSYKTWMALDLAISVAGDYRFLGKHEVLRPGPVVIIQQEDPQPALVNRMSMLHFQRQHGDQDILVELPDDLSPRPPWASPPFQVNLLSALPIFLHTDKMFSLVDKRALKGLERLIRAVRPVLVIIDPLYAAGETDDYMAKTAKQMVVLKALRDAYGCSFMVVHHTKKENKRDKESDEIDHGRELIWGSQFLNASLETGWQLRLTGEENTVSILRHFKAAQTQQVVRLHIDIKESASRQRHLYHITEIGGTKDKDEIEIVGGQRSDILKVLEESKEPLTVTQISNRSGMHRTTVSNKMRDLVRTNVVVKINGKYKLAEGVTF